MTLIDYADAAEVDDRVELKFGAEQVQIVERYSFHTAILQQPSAFTVIISAAQGAAALLSRYPARTPCSLWIAGQKQFTGEIDARVALGDAQQTTIELHGRDLMARLHDVDIEAERSFTGATYQGLLEAALDDVGLPKARVVAANTSNRLVRSGTKVRASNDSAGADGKRGPAPDGQVATKLGETWLQFLERHVSRIGLFIWCTADGEFVLSRPNGDQSPTFHFYRTGKSGRETCNVEKIEFTNDTTHRFSEVVIYARNGGRKSGFNHTHGGFPDLEMVGLGIKRRRVFRDADVSTPEEAEFYARRRIAEINRSAWRLQYTISGHSAPTLISTTDRAIVCPDMVARVDDDELGIHDNLYIESVEYRSPPRETVITMMRIQDLLFGELQTKAAVQKAVKKLDEIIDKDPRNELDILGLRVGSYGTIARDSDLNKSIEHARELAVAQLKKEAAAQQSDPDGENDNAD